MILIKNLSIKLSLVFCLFILFASSHIQAQSDSWELAWSDEFDYSGLPDASRWSYDVGGHGWGNQEEQFYTDKRSENARVEGDQLIIEARRESFGGRNYTSSRLISKEKGDWTYGRVEVRAQLPSGRGTWPAIWMLPTNSSYGNGRWPQTGEIDIMEHVGHDQGKIHATIHTEAFNHLQNTQKGQSINIPTASTSLHVYSLEWTPTELEFSIDGNEYFTYTKGSQNWRGWPFDTDFHLILNIAIGGSWGGQQGIDNNIFPQQMVIDYVRVYRYTGLPKVTLNIPSNIVTGQDISFTGTASDPDGQIRRVELYQRDGLIQRLIRDTDQWTIPVENISQGCYMVHATVVDNGGWSTSSDPRPLNIGADCSSLAPYLMSPHPISDRIEAEYYDLGGPRVAYRDLSPDNDGKGIRLDEGVDVYPTTDGVGYHIGNTSRREWVKYTVNVDKAGIYDFQIRLASKSDVVSFSVEFDDEDKISEFESPISNSNFQTIRVITDEGIQLNEGTQILKLTFHRGTPSVNWMRFRLRPSRTNNEPLDDLDQTILLGNYPNPFTTSTTIDYQIGRPGHVVLELFNTLGQHVRTLANHHHQSGHYSTILNAYGLSPGIYIYRLSGDVTANALLSIY